MESYSTLRNLLAARISEGGKPIVFVVGSGLSLPRDGSPGVPSASTMVGRIREILKKHGATEKLTTYQEAFAALIKTLGVAEANCLVQRAVLEARREPTRLGDGAEDLRRLEADIDGWYVSDAHRAIALLAAHYPGALGGMVLTTNFDPLLEVALAKSRVPWFGTSLHQDGSLLFTRGTGPHVVHLHGHWWHSDTLHTDVQLSGVRPLLKASLRETIARSTLVVIGYSGWKDILMSTLRDEPTKDVIWCLYEKSEAEAHRQASELRPAIGDKATFGFGIDAEELLPELLRLLLSDKPAETSSLFLERLWIRHDHGDVYESTNARDWEPTDDFAGVLGNHCKRLDRFEPGLAARAAVHAARFLLRFVDQQGVHQAYRWTEGTPLRLLLLDAMALLDGDRTKRTNVSTGEMWAFDYLTDPKRHGFLRAAVAETIQDAVCAVLSWDEARLRMESDPTKPICEIEEAAAYASTRFDDSGGVGRVEFSWPVWAAKAMHRAYRILHNDGRSLIGYVRACIDGEADHQEWFDGAAQSEWRKRREAGAEIDALYRNLGERGSRHTDQ